MTRFAAAFLFAAFLFATVLVPTSARAGEETVLPQSTADIMWLVLAGLLVFFMQAGFSMLESGLTRAKNAVNILTKNLLDFSLGALMFWAVGYAIMYGESGTSWFGWSSDYLFMSTMNEGADPSMSAGWFFQMVFAATAATIVSGAVAERTKLIGYLAFSVLITALIYPVAGHWIWASDGWLSGLGMRDFAGSTVVHSVGGWAALAGAILVGPRIGKFKRDGTPNVIPGHSLPMAALGTFILWFGWFGFNAGSTLSATGGIAHVVVTTTLAAAAGAMAALFTTWWRYGKPDLSMALNGCLAGLVGITAGCASVSASSAVIIGLIAGIIVFYAMLFIERRLKIDDPVGAIAVHGVCGAWGTLAIGLFGQRTIDIAYWDGGTAIQDGLLFGGGFAQLGVQAAGVFTVLAYSFGLAFAVFSLIKVTVGLRADEEHEVAGLDIGEHGMPAYANFDVAKGMLPHDPPVDLGLEPTQEATVVES